MMRCVTTISLLIFLLLNARGQDIHFSQYYASPLNTNPASTGWFPADYRIGLNFKQQWPWANASRQYNYITSSVYADVGLFEEQLRAKDKVGLGIIALNDHAGTGNLSTTKIGLTGAYHLTLGQNENVFVSIGASGQFVQKTVDYEKLTFDGQWNDIVFDNDLPSGEGSSFPPIRYVDVGAGLNLTFAPDEEHQYTFGGAVYHLNQPRESYFQDANRLGFRPIGNASAYIGVSEVLHIEPSVAFMYQKGASELLATTLAGFSMQDRRSIKNSILFVGVEYRSRDALIPVLGYQYKLIRLLVNYDINLSTLSKASRAIGGVEFSLVYTGLLPSNPRRKQIFCPRM